MKSELRNELGSWWPLWMVMYGIVCGAGGAAFIIFGTLYVLSH